MYIYMYMHHKVFKSCVNAVQSIASPFAKPVALYVNVHVCRLYTFINGKSVMSFSSSKL